MSKLYYCVVEDWQGNVTISSFGGRNKTEERKFALSGNRFCWKITTDFAEAQRYASIQRASIARCGNGR